MFGRKTFKVLKLLKKGSAYSFVHLCGVVELPDWILDASWIHWKGPESYQIVVITAHNVCIRYNMVDGMAVTDWYQNEVSCILYPFLWPELHVQVYSELFLTFLCQILSFGSWESSRQRDDNVGYSFQRDSPLACWQRTSRTKVPYLCQGLLCWAQGTKIFLCVCMCVIFHAIVLWCVIFSFNRVSYFR